MAPEPLRIVVWNDYICPWAYAARPLTDWLVAEATDRGAVVDRRCFELHPELPLEGVPVRSGGRLDQVFDHIADECATASLPFAKPARSPNSRRILSLVEIVRAQHPEAWTALDQAIATAHWVEGRDLRDHATLADLLVTSGLDATAVFEAEADGVGERLLDEARASAREVGVTGTPAWQVGELVITGLHPPAQFQRWFGRILDKHPATSPNR